MLKIPLNKILLELAKRKLRKDVSILDTNFKYQTEFINDPAKLKVLFCTRRAAKSYTLGLHLIKEAMETSGVSCLYIGLTRDSAKRIMWKDILKDINKKKKLGIKFNESALTATLPNGSIIYLIGVDSNEDEKNKALGQKYKLAVIDEGASFTIDLRELIYGILKPAMTDLRGTICIAGTSGNLAKGLFYDITTSNEPGWKLYKWSALDNPYQVVQWQEELDDIALNRPLFMETTIFKQWYLNLWVIDDSKLVYKFTEARNRFKVLPIHRRGDWTYVLGVDLGYDDDSAFTVMTYHTSDKTLFILETFKQKHMDITDVATKIKSFQSKYDISKVIVDGSAKQAVQEMQNRHGITLDAADKIGKTDFIEIMNAEFVQGNIKLSDNCTPLVEEYSGLIWNDRSSRREEHPSCPNHLCDSTLYAWRYCYQYMSKAPLIKPRAGTKEWYEDQERLMLESALDFQNR